MANSSLQIAADYWNIRAVEARLLAAEKLAEAARIVLELVDLGWAGIGDGETAQALRAALAAWEASK
jgi:hypothetical protein